MSYNPQGHSTARAFAYASRAFQPSGAFGQFRAVKQGPEADLVDAFLCALPILPVDGMRLTVFREPMLESGSPDLVAVVWDPEVARRRAVTDTELSKREFQLLQLLCEVGPQSASALRHRFGTRVPRELDRLRLAGLVSAHHDVWRASPLDDIFAIKDIFAVEAKIQSWGVALAQAMANTWFASRSFLLTPKLKKDAKVVEQATHLGLGIWSADEEGVAEVLSAARRPLPRSYASWIFNEWAWRMAAAESSR